MARWKFGTDLIFRIYAIKSWQQILARASQQSQQRVKHSFHESMKIKENPLLRRHTALGSEREVVHPRAPGLLGKAAESILLMTSQMCGRDPPNLGIPTSPEHCSSGHKANLVMSSLLHSGSSSPESSGRNLV